MLKNYITVAIRNFLRNKVFSMINIAGLSAGISTSLVLVMIATYEFSFDKFEQDRDRIYRVIIEAKHGGDINYSAAVPAALGGAVERELTGIEQIVPLFTFQGDGTAKVSIKSRGSVEATAFKKQDDIIFTSNPYFRLLPYKWLAGSPTKPLLEPFTVILTESRARLYFPRMPLDKIIGQLVTYNDTLTTTVTGIVAELQGPTFFTAHEFISSATVMATGLKENFMMNVWNDWMAYSQLFIKVTEGNTPQRAEANINRLFRKYNPEAYKSDNEYLAFRLQPLSEVHFKYESFGHRVAHKPALFGLLAIAGFLLLLGCINFINLTTANAAKRAKEIGVRKTMGSTKKQLLLQFLTETFLITVLATIVATVLASLLLKAFNDLLPPRLEIDLLRQPLLLSYLVLLPVILAIAAGFYPAWILSNYKPVAVLKDSPVGGTSEMRSVWIRRALTTTQFVIAQFFLIATLVVSKQIHFSLTKDLGFKKKAILNFAIPGDPAANTKSILLEKIKAVPGVQIASLGFLPPAAEGPAYTNIKLSDGNNDPETKVQIRWGDTNYLKLYDIRIIAGRNVQQSDTVKEFVINEKYGKALGFRHPEDALNKFLAFNGRNLPIVGVMHDFNQLSLHEAVEPVVFTCQGKQSGFVHIALDPSNSGDKKWSVAISRIQKAFAELYPDSEISYSFLDETIARFYESELRTQRLLNWATAFSIFISCLGLFGLVIYTTHARHKEIGIRKILGASVASIVSLLSLDFVRLVLLAFLIAAPVAWWGAQQWLQNFYYRAPINVWVFLLSATVMVLFALMTLCLQTIKAALTNPVKSLRTE